MPVTNNDTSIASEFLNWSQPVVVFATEVVPSEPPESENVIFDVSVLNKDTFAVEPHAVPVFRLAVAGCANQCTHCDCAAITFL